MNEQDCKKLAELLFPDVDKTPDYYEEKYPYRKLPNKAEVTRLGPSPTGFIHLGNLYSALADERIAHKNGGVFYLRIEDTDQEREVEGAVDMIYKVMDQTGLGYDEGPNKPGEVGPYVQSERLAIYKEYADKLVELGGAHYCFCDEETINKAKEESDNEELGYIDPCKHLSLEEAKQRKICCKTNNSKYWNYFF